MKQVKIVPMAAEHLDRLEQLERMCFSRPWSKKCWRRSWTTSAPPFWWR